jgi:hypothetical protein
LRSAQWGKRGKASSTMCPLVNRRVEIVINGDDTYEDLLGVSDMLCQIASEAGFATTRHLGMWRFDTPLRSPTVYLLYTATSASSQWISSSQSRGGSKTTQMGP